MHSQHICAENVYKGATEMNNFKLLLKIFERNKFQKNFMIAIMAVFTAIEAYLLIAGISGGANSIEILQTTLRMLSFLIIFLMFFSYECFSKIHLYKESFSVCKKNIASVYKNELAIFVCYTAFLTAVALLINVIFIIVNGQFSIALLFYTIARLLCYFFLCLLAAVFIGLILSNIGRKKRYIAYLLMVVFAFSEMESIQISSMHMLESSGKDYSKLLEFFSLVPDSLRWSPNEIAGLALNINKISLLLFFIVLSVLIFILVNNKSKTERLWKSVLCLICCGCLLSVYFIPISVPKMDLSASGTVNDDMYYIHYKDGKPDPDQDVQQEKAADFQVKKYDLNFSAYLNLKAEAKVYVDQKNLSEYNFTLYHKYKVSNVTNQSGTPLRFTQEHDYITVNSGNNEIEYLCIEYYGSSAQYYSGYAGIFLPANFLYYPIPGFYRTFDAENRFLDHSLPYKTAFDVQVHSLKKVYCNLEEKGENQFSGKANSITLVSGYYDTYKINDTTVIYPYFSKSYEPSEMEKELGPFIEKNKNIKKIMIIPNMNMSQYEQIRTYDNYLFTYELYEIEQRSFESKIDINKKDLYFYVSFYYDPDTTQADMARYEEEAKDEAKKYIPIIKKLVQSKYKETALKEINDYLIDSNDNRSPLDFMNALGEKYA